MSLTKCTGVAVFEVVLCSAPSVPQPVFTIMEKALVEAFSVIVKTGCGTNGAIRSTIKKATRSPGGSQAQVRGQESPVQV